MSMNSSRANHAVSALTTAKKLGTELFQEMAPKVLFFFVAFGILLLLFKLFVAQYSIAYSAFAKAAVAALIMGKVVPLLDWAESGCRFDNYRRIVVIAGKTLLYGLVVIVIGIGEKIVEAFREDGSWSAAVNSLIANSNIDRFLGLVLLISLVVGAYLTIQEIDRALGEGALYRLLFERPASDSDNR